MDMKRKRLGCSLPAKRRLLISLATKNIFLETCDAAFCTKEKRITAGKPAGAAFSLTRTPKR